MLENTILLKTITWELHGELLKSKLSDYAVVKIDREILHDLCFPSPRERVEKNFNFMKNNDRIWMPVIKFKYDKSRNITDYKYIQGTHTAYVSACFCDELYIMFLKSEIEAFRNHTGLFDAKIIDAENYQALPLEPINPKN